MAWISVFKTAACFLCGGAIMGVLRGSTASGILAGVILFGLFLAVAGAVLAVDYAGRKPAPRPLPRYRNRDARRPSSSPPAAPAAK